MNRITLKNHPESVAVFYTDDSEMRAAAAEAFTLIHQPQYSAVVVLRPTDTLQQTFNIVKDNPHVGQKFYPMSISHRQIIDRGDTTVLSLNDIETRCGPDFARMAEFYKNFGTGSFNIRGLDGEGNRYPHLDTGYQLDQEDIESLNISDLITDQSQKIPSYGVTLTMASHGGGTQLLEVSPKEFSREEDEEGHVWTWWQEKKDPKHWAAPNGAIVILRSEAWPEGYYPQLHRSPYRRKDGDPYERAVGVGFVYSL